jgi:hypothetical protein
MKKLMFVLVLLLPNAVMARQGDTQTLRRPKIEGSMVGYIDNANIGSHVRVRFDAGFHTEFPDRAEFFYAKCGCYKDLAGSGLPSYDPDAPGPRPGVATDLNFQQLYLNVEYAPHARFSLFTEFPYRFLQPQKFVPGFGSFGNQSGLGDIRAGFKLGVVNSPDRSLTLQFRVYAPSGEDSRGLGTGHASIEPAVLYYQKIGQRFSVEGQFSDWQPTAGSPGVRSTSDPSPQRFSGNVLSYGIGAGYEVFNNDQARIAPVVEFVGWRVISGFQTTWASAESIAVEADDTNIVNLKVGARIGIGDRNSIYIGYGHGLTDAVWYKDLMRVEYRYAF